MHQACFACLAMGQAEQAEAELHEKILTLRADHLQHAGFSSLRDQKRLMQELCESRNASK